MDSDPQLPLETKGNHLEQLIVGLRRWVPSLLHTYYVMVRRPRDYLRQIKGGQAPANTVGPAAFWFTNAVICKAFSTQSGAKPFSSLATTSEGIGLIAGTAICALFLSAILDIHGWRGFKRMVRVIFTGALFFIPMSAASLVPIPGNLFENLLGPVVLGTDSSVRWVDLTGLALALAVMTGWFVWVGFGIREVFRKSKAAITLALLSIPAFLVTCGLFALIGYLMIAMRTQMRVVVQGLGPARVALMKSPPDYFASGRSFEALYKSESPFVRRPDRIRARIGSVAAGLATVSVMMKLPEAERKFYAAQNAALSDDTETAARSLSEGVALVRRRGKVWRGLAESSEKEVREIKRMMTSEAYTPWEPKAKQEAKSEFHFPTPALFP